MAAAGAHKGDESRWMVDGGRPAKPDHTEGHSAYATLYCTGHQVRAPEWASIGHWVVHSLHGDVDGIRSCPQVHCCFCALTPITCQLCTNCVCLPCLRPMLHQDGGVRLWDMFSEVPMLLGCAPSREAASVLDARAVARPVSTLEFAWEQGLLITGHEGGEVRAKCHAPPQPPNLSITGMT